MLRLDVIFIKLFFLVGNGQIRSTADGIVDIVSEYQLTGLRNQKYIVSPRLQVLIVYVVIFDPLDRNLLDKFISVFVLEYDIRAWYTADRGRAAVFVDRRIEISGE